MRLTAGRRSRLFQFRQESVHDNANSWSKTGINTEAALTSLYNEDKKAIPPIRVQLLSGKNN